MWELKLFVADFYSTNLQ